MNRWKWAGIGLAGLFGIYCLLGFFVAPSQLKKQLISQAKQQAGVDMTLGRVKVNPLALSVTLEQLSSKDRQARDLLAAERIYLNLQLWPLLSKTLRLRQLTLEQPNVNLILTATGDPHWLDSLPATSDPAGASAPDGDSGEPWIFSIDQTQVSDGLVRYSDQPHPESYATQIGGLNFALAGLTTQAGEPAPVSMVFAHEGQGEVRLEGAFALTPLAFNGQLTVKDLQLEPSWRYARYLHGIALASGTLNGSLEIDLDGRDVLEITTSAGSWNLTDTNMTLADGSPLLTMDTLSLSGPDLSLAQRKIVIPRIALNAGRLNLTRDAQGQLVLPEAAAAGSGQGPVALAEDESGEAIADDFANVSADVSADVSGDLAVDASGMASQPPPADTDGGFAIELQQLLIEKLPISWLDQAVQPEVAQTLTVDSLKVSAFDLKPGTRFPVALQATVDGGQISWQGSHVLTPVSLDGTLELAQLPLPWLTGYIRESAALNLDSGDLGAVLEVSVAGGVDIAGSIGLASLDTSSAEQPLAGFSQLDIEGLKLSMPEQGPVTLNIATVSLREPAATFAIAADGSSNLSRLSGAGDNSPDPSALEGAAADETAAVAGVAPTVEAEAGPEAGPEPVITLQALNISGGTLKFSDASVEPAFSANVTDFGGSLTGFNSNVDSPAELDFAGRLEGYADIAITGSLNPQEERSNVTLSTRNVDLTSANAYAGKYVGRLIQRGRMDLDLGYELDGNNLKGNNKVTLGQLTLGSQVSSEDAVSLPLDLALALLKDGSGNIDLGVPVAGQLDDPKFRIGSVVFKALVNLIVKAVASPFSLIGKLIPGGGEDLQFVNFSPGVADLSEEGSKRLGLLAQALLQRPNLRLDIAGVASRDLDAAAIQRAQLSASLGLDALEAEARKAALRQAYEAQIGALPLLAADPDSDQTDADDQVSAGSDQASGRSGQASGRSDQATVAPVDMAMVEQQLLASIAVSDESLRELAGARAAAIKIALGAVDASLTERAYVLESRVVELSGSDQVVLELVLAAAG